VRVIVVFVALFELGLAGPLYAQPSKPTEQQCGGAATRAETLSCYLRAAARSRAEVDRAFERDVQRANALDHAASGSSLENGLRASQAEWIRYSNAQCSFEGQSSFGGSGTDILVAACQDRLNSARSSELNSARALLNR